MFVALEEIIKYV